MSYCRFGWDGSDVYVFGYDGGIECCGCRFGNNFTASSPEEMISHLALHRRAGHFVPDHAIMGLWEDVPGAQVPARPEPVELTKASIMMTVAQLQFRLKEIANKEKGQA